MESTSEANLLDAIAKLEAITLSLAESENSKKIHLEFDFSPRVVGPYGNVPHWTGVLNLEKSSLVHYGRTIEEVVLNLLHLIQHPELYVDKED